MRVHLIGKRYAKAEAYTLASDCYRKVIYKIRFRIGSWDAIEGRVSAEMLSLVRLELKEGDTVVDFLKFCVKLPHINIEVYKHKVRMYYIEAVRDDWVFAVLEKYKQS